MLESRSYRWGGSTLLVFCSHVLVRDVEKDGVALRAIEYLLSLRSALRIIESAHPLCRVGASASSRMLVRYAAFRIEQTVRVWCDAAISLESLI